MRRLATFALLLAVTALAPAAIAASKGSIWSIVPSPSPGTDVFNADLEGVAATAPGDAWAVGSDSAASPQTGLAEHWDGGSWTVAPTPVVAGRDVQLHAVSALTPQDVWAVGDSIQAGHTETETVIEHWDGMHWSVVPSPNVDTSVTAANTLGAVTAVSTKDVWAAGWAIDPTGTTIELLFEHWNGRKWTIATSPTPPGAFQFATGIHAIATNDVWAVGYDSTGSPDKTVAAHWDGHAWSLVDTPNLMDGMPPDNRLIGVTATGPNDVWAVGYELGIDGLNRQRTLIEHWNGSAWSIVPSPSPGTGGSELFGVTAVSPGDVWAVGESRNFNSGVQTSVTLQWNGARWTRVQSPNGFLTTTPLAAASLPDGTVWAVGGTEQKHQCCLRTLVLQTTQG